MPHSGLRENQHPSAYAFGSAIVSSTAKSISHADFGFSAQELSEAKRAIINAHANAVHYRYDGGNPTNTIGMMLDDATGGSRPAVVLGNTNINNLIFIRESGTDSTVSIQLEK